MKPFFAVDRTENDNNKTDNCAEYNVLCVSEETHKEWKAFYAEDAQLQKKLKGSRTKQIAIAVFAISIFAALLYVANRLTRYFDLNFSDPGYYIIYALIFIIACFLPYLYKRYYIASTNKFFQSDEVKRFNQKSVNLERKTRAELNIPDDFIMADIIWFHYKVINGIITPVPEAKKAPLYFNPSYWFYNKDNCLYIADGLNSFAVEKTALKRIKRINKDITLPRWKKQKPFTDPEYNEYHIIKKGYSFNVESYYALEIEDAHWQWELYFPNYELPAFEKLTGLKADQN